MKAVAKRKMLKRVSLLMVLVFTLSLSFAALAAETELYAIINDAAKYVHTVVKSPQVGSVGGEWAIIGLARSGYAVPQEYYDNYYATVVKYVEACKGNLHEKKYTEYSRVILSMTAIGRDPSNVGGYNLLTALGDFEKTIWQGINGPVWALIALDSGNYEIPNNPNARTQATRELYIEEILSRQLADGGFSLSGTGGSKEKADPDITGMVLQALAKYQSRADVKAATEKALVCISNAQSNDGGFSSWGEENIESVVQVIVALCEMGIDIEDSRFIKNGKTLVDSLLSYYVKGGGFRHTMEGGGNNQMSTEQGLYACVAITRAAEGKHSLYRMSDTEKNSGDIVDGGYLPGKHADVTEQPIVNPGMTFEDITLHDNLAAIETLSARGIINGMGDGTFVPNATMTRAQFAAIVVRALGLEPVKKGVFSDVDGNEWYAAYIDTANAYGIVNGVGDGKFNPAGTITRQEAATMVARAAKLCGMDTEMDAAEIRDMLAQFGDYVTVTEWAKQGLAFCYDADILSQAELDIHPNADILRCEIAQMLYNMLSSAKLI